MPTIVKTVKRKVIDQRALDDDWRIATEKKVAASRENSAQTTKIVRLEDRIKDLEIRLNSAYGTIEKLELELRAPRSGKLIAEAKASARSVKEIESSGHYQKLLKNFQTVNASNESLTQSINEYKTSVQNALRITSTSMKAAVGEVPLTRAKLERFESRIDRLGQGQIGELAGLVSLMSFVDLT